MKSIKWTTIWFQVLDDVALQLTSKILDGLWRAKEVLMLGIELRESFFTALDIAEHVKLVDRLLPKLKDFLRHSLRVAIVLVLTELL